MARVKAVSSNGVLQGISFLCPGCGEIHCLPVSEGAPHGLTLPPDQRVTWSFNGDLDRPSFHPSINAKSGHHASNKPPGNCYCDAAERTPDWDNDFTCYICHSWVKDGSIQFLDDCTHALKGQSVELPNIEVNQ